MSLALHKLSALGGSELGFVVHAGAGSCRQPQHYLQLGADDVLLIEAVPQLAASLRALTSGLEGVRVEEGALSPTEAEQDFYLLNNPVESSLLKPSALLEQFPNLKLRQVCKVRTLRLDRLLQSVVRREGRSNVLVLEIKGMEHEVLRGLNSEDFEKFDFLVLETAAQPLYEGAVPASQTIDVLHAHGFDVVDAPVRPHLARQSLILRLDRGRAQLVQLHRNVSNQQSRIAELEAALAVEVGRTEDAEKQVAEKSAVISGLQAQLEEEAQKCKRQAGLVARQEEELGRIRPLVASLEQTKTDLESQFGKLRVQSEEEAQKSKQQAALLSRQEEELGRLRPHAAALEQRNAELESKLKEVLQKCKLQEERVARHEEDLQGVRPRVAALEKRNSELGAQLEAESKEFEARLKKITEDHERESGLAATRQKIIHTLNGDLKNQASRYAALDEKLGETDAEYKALQKRVAEQQRTIETLTAKEEERARLAGEDQQRVKSLEKRNHENNARQHLLDSELVKAEVQLELIKDILIREKAF